MLSRLTLVALYPYIFHCCRPTFKPSLPLLPNRFDWVNNKNIFLPFFCDVDFSSRNDAHFLSNLYRDCDLIFGSYFRQFRHLPRYTLLILKNTPCLIPSQFVFLRSLHSCLSFSSLTIPSLIVKSLQNQRPHLRFISVIIDSYCHLL